MSRRRNPKPTPPPAAPQPQQPELCVERWAAGGPWTPLAPFHGPGALSRLGDRCARFQVCNLTGSGTPVLYRVGCPDTGLWLDECDQTNPDYDSCGLFIVRDSRARPLSTFHYDSELSRETMLASDRIARMLMYPAPIDLMPLSREPRADYGAGLPRPAWWGTLPDDDVRLYLGRIAGVLPAGN